MKKIVFVLIFFLLFQFIYANESVIIGEKVTIHSNILDEDRTFLIYLPSDYTETDLHYPVLFQIQGSETLFHKATGEIRYLSEFRAEIPPIIVVNILFTNYRRDIFPIAVPSIPGTGGSDNFLAFIETELIPHLEVN